MICDMDCLNCSYPDCINEDSPTLEEYRVSSEIERENRRSGLYEDRRARERRRVAKYRREHPEQVKAYAGEYREANRERERERVKRWQAENQERLYARQKRYREKRRFQERECSREDME